MATSNMSAKIDPLVEEVLEGSQPSPSPPSPLTRTPSGRLREKIVRNSYSSASKRQSDNKLIDNSPQNRLEVISTGDMAEAAPPQLVSTGIDKFKAEENSNRSSSNQVPVSANIDKKTAHLPRADQTHNRSLKLAQRGFHLDTSNSPEEPRLPGAFSVAGIGSTEDDAPPAVESVVVDVEELPIAAELADEGKPVEASKMDDVFVNCKSRKVWAGIFLLLCILVGAIVGGALIQKRRKVFAPIPCQVEEPAKLGNGRCDGGDYNSEICEWDMGDCEILNEYPDCALTPEQSANLGDGKCDGPPLFAEPCGYDAGDCTDCIKIIRTRDRERIGNGVCDGGEFNTAECGWDGGDCIVLGYPECHVTNPEKIGDGFCHGGEYNTIDCGWEGGDCFDFNIKYPGCSIDYPELRLGDGECDGFLGANTPECKWDEGDCVVNGFPDCHVDYPQYISDGICDGGDYNSPQCGWDGGDCAEFNKAYPDCRLGDETCASFNRTFPLCSVHLPEFIGNGICNGGKYNTDECGLENGDCLQFNKDFPYCHVDDATLIGDGRCHFLFGYNTVECGWDGGDCDMFNQIDFDEECILENLLLKVIIGDGECDGGELNTAECKWDGGDCIEFNQKYPDCQVDDATWIGDGECDFGVYNRAECGWDGGDCINHQLQNCHVDDPHLLADGICDGGTYNTEECDWDGGDCTGFNEQYSDCIAENGGCASFNGTYPGCIVQDPAIVGNSVCDEGEYNTAECKWDGGDCLDFNQIDFTVCAVQTKEFLADGGCDGGEYNVEECKWDAGDCTEFNKLYPDCHVGEAYWIGDGECDGGDYNTAECGWDGGDCLEFNRWYPDCEVAFPRFVGDGVCDGGDYNTAECGWDGGDCS